MRCQDLPLHPLFPRACCAYSCCFPNFSTPQHSGHITEALGGGGGRVGEGESPSLPAQSFLWPQGGSQGTFPESSWKPNALILHLCWLQPSSSLLLEPLLLQLGFLTCSCDASPAGHRGMEGGLCIVNAMWSLQRTWEGRRSLWEREQGSTEAAYFISAYLSLSLFFFSSHSLW